MQDFPSNVDSYSAGQRMSDCFWTWSFSTILAKFHLRLCPEPAEFHSYIHIVFP
jgi:hypothetical protein